MHYDVIIIGGRNAGSSLAIRLARQHLRVLMVDRASFPSLPAVPSSPIIHAGTMRLMDELDIPESAYTYPDGRIDHYIMSVPGYFDAVMPTALMGIDRNYSSGIDRNRFDTVLWNEAQKYPTVTAIERFNVTTVWKDAAGKVTGMTGKSPAGSQTFTADLVVGADGRFSFAAGQFGADVVEEHNQYTGATYHAEWENVDPYSAEHPHTLTMYNTMKDLVVLFIPINTRKYIVGFYVTTAKATFGPQNLENVYCEAIKAIPAAWNRLKNATKVTPVVGVKRIQNGYRKAYGEGWVLAGDALHYKDPIDGQGIYDALMSTKLLAESIALWKKGEMTWMEAGEQYKQRFYEASHPMFLQTVSRIKQEVYTPVPPLILKTVLRWTLTDPEYQKGFLKYIHRAIDPADRPSPKPAMFLRGIVRDLKSFVS